MKQVLFDFGGRPFNNDDLVTLQGELTAAVQAQFLGKGPFILSGCQVSGPANGPKVVSAGIVCLDGELLRFAGQSNVALPAQLQAGAPVRSDPRPYQTGGTKQCMREVPAVLVPTDDAYNLGEFLPIYSWGGKRWEDVQRASVRYIGELQEIATAGYVASDYDVDGLGKPGTSAWGWGLCNGEAGRDSLLGRFTVGLDPNNPAFDTPGKSGGEETHTLTLAQLPTFRPTMPRVASPGGRNDGSVLLKGGNPGDASLLRWQGEPVGGGQPHNNLPPYATVIKRQWVGY